MHLISGAAGGIILIITPSGRILPMKKTALILLTILLLLPALHGCRSPENGDGFSIVTTIFPVYDFTRAIVGDRGSVTNLLRPGEETHSYEPTPADIIKIKNADVFIYIGGESDTWVDTVLASLDTPTIKIVALIDSVNVLEEEEDHEHDEHRHDHDHGYDEHIWTSPVNAIKMTEKIAEAVIAADPDGADIYRGNLDSYRNELESLDSMFRKTVNDAKRKTVVLADRFPFLYFEHEYGLEFHAAYSGCSDESDVSAGVIAGLIKTVKDENIPVVFMTELSSGRIAETVSSATGSGILTLHSCSNVSKAETEAGETYISLMKKNNENLKAALG